MSSLQFALLGSFLALMIGYWALSQVIAYPGVQATQYIAPTFALCLMPWSSSRSSFCVLNIPAISLVRVLSLQ
jgi:hypothetical protein